MNNFNPYWNNNVANNFNNVNNNANNNINNTNFNNANTFNGQTACVLPPIVTRRTNVVHRYYVIEQPHICENETKIINHYIKRHKFIPKQYCCEENAYSEENAGCCCNN